MATHPQDQNTPTPTNRKLTQAQPPLPPDDISSDELLQLEQAEAELSADRPAPEKPAAAAPPPAKPEVSDAQIDLGLLGPSPESGETSSVSFVQWSSLVSDKSAAGTGASEVRIDAPSDADMLLDSNPSSREGAAPPERPKPPSAPKLATPAAPPPAPVSDPEDALMSDLEEMQRMLAEQAEQAESETQVTPVSAHIPVLNIDALEKGEESAPPPDEQDDSMPFMNLDALEKGSDEEVLEVFEEETIDLAALIGEEEPAEPEPVAVEDDEVIDLNAVEPASGVSSMIDLGAETVVEDASPAPESAMIDLGAVEVVEDAVVETASGMIELGIEEVVEEAGPASDVIELGDDLVVVEEASPSRAESGVIDFDIEEAVEEEAAAAESGVIDLGDDLVVVEEASAAKVESGVIDFDIDEMIEEPAAAGESGVIDLDPDEVSIADASLSGKVESGLIDFAAEEMVEEEAAAKVESGVLDLGDDLVVVEEASGNVEAGTSGIDLDKMIEEEIAAPDSGDIDLDQMIEEEVAAPESGAIDLDAVVAEAEVSVSGIEFDMEEIEEVAELAGASGVLEAADLEVIVEGAAEGPDPEMVDLEEEILESGSEVDLGEESAVPDPTASRRDLIAAAVESGMDLDMPGMDLDEGAPPDLPLEMVSPEQDASAVDLGPPKTAELPVSSPSNTGVSADAEEIDLEALLDNISDAGVSASKTSVEDEELVDVPLEEVEIESDAIDLSSIPDRVADSAPASGIHSEEEVDLEALLDEQLTSGSYSGSTRLPGVPAQSEQLPEADDEEIDLTTPGSSNALHRAALEEEGIDLNDMETATGSGSGLLIDEALEDEVVVDEEEVIVDEEIEVPVDEEIVDEEAEEEGVVPRSRRKAEEEEEMVPPKPRSRTGALIGGTFLGTLVGAGACFAVLYYNLIPGLLPSSDKPATANLPNKGPVNPGPAPQTLTAAQALKQGDLEAAAKAGIEKGEKPEELALRGQYRWENYLVKQTKGKAPINLEDAPVKEAINDLKTASDKGNADALFELGRLEEQAGKLDEAAKTYQGGADKFPGDRRFTAGVNRVTVFQPLPPPPEAPKEPEKKDAEKPKEPEQPKEEKKDPEKKDAEPKPPAEGMSQLPDSARSALWALLLVGLQDPMPNPNQPAAEPEEAGFDFWEAAKLAKEQKYDDAIKALEKAKKLHQERRILRLRKPQNPNSDPNEDIFLRACDELKLAWQVQERLQKGGYLNLADKRDPTRALDTALKEVMDARQAQLTVGKKLVDEKIIDKPEDLVAGVDKLLEARKTDATTITDLKTKADDLGKKLTTAKIIDKPEDLAAGVDKLLEDRKNDKVTITDLQTKTDTLDKDLKTKTKEAADRDEMLGKVQQELFEGRYVDNKEDRTLLVRGMRDALRTASTKDPAGEMRDLRKQVGALEDRRKKEVADIQNRMDTEVARLNDLRKQEVGDIQKKMDTELARINTEREKDTATLRGQLQKRRPATDMLAIWLPTLEGATREQSLKAITDANLVIDDPMVPPATKAQAKVVLGLALRNVEKFDEAKMVLTETKAGLPADAKDWQKADELALKEVSDPAGYFAIRTEEHRNRNERDQARLTLDRGIKALGDNNAALVAERALLLLDQAKQRSPDGKPKVGDRDLEQALKDAEEAIQKTMGKDDQKKARAFAFYARGRIHEELDMAAQAREDYLAAVQEYPAADGFGSRFRLAYARMLAQPRPGKPPLPAGKEVPPAEQPKEKEKEKDKEANKIGRLPTMEEIRQLAANPETEEQARQALVVLLTVGLQPPEPPAQPGQAEAQKQADIIIKQAELDPKSVRFNDLAEAYRIKGMWTRALMTYVEGLKPYLRAEYYDELMTLLRSHPQLRRPEAVNNPFEGETQFSRGLRLYFAREYGDAEKHFKAATEYDNQDARYYYYLGLSRLMLGKPEAAEDFAFGARLEKQNMPNSQEVSKSLERVQGPPRRVLNEARFAPR